MENGPKDEEEVMRSTSSTLPVQPRNGTMKTYENPSRTFTRPYSAKTVYFYKGGDLFFTGVRLPVSHHRYKTLQSLMDDLNRTMFLPYGVRNITTPMGRTNITDLDQLQHLGRYVASSSNPPKGVDLDKIQEKYSATQRREPNRTTAGGQAYWMPTTPTLPNRINATRILRALNLIAAKLVFFVLNGKGKFHRSLINPMKMPKMEQLLEECSTHLEVAIHRLYTPEGKLITTVEEILAYDGPRIIACPRNERPLVHEKSDSNKVKLPEINPSRYAPRQPYIKTVSEANTSTGGSGGAGTSGSSSGNSIEKRLPAINNRYHKRSPLENGYSHVTTTNYMSKSYAIKAKNPVPLVNERQTNNVVTKRTTVQKSRKATARDSTDASSAASTAPKDSGTGTSINSQQSDRPASMTDRKAQMIRDELRANLKSQHQSSSEQYSEEDMIREEESDYDHLESRGIQSGTSDEDNEEKKSLGKRKKSAKNSAESQKSSHRTLARMTPSTSGGSGKASAEKRIKTMSRQDTPYNETPSRPSTSELRSPTPAAASKPGTSSSRLPSASTKPGTAQTSSSRLPSRAASSQAASSRASTSSRAILEPSDDEEEDQEVERLPLEDDDSEEDDDDDSILGTPAAHTPDTRLPTAASIRSFDSDSSRAWSRISGYSDKEVILPSDDEFEIAATKIQKYYKKYRQVKTEKKRYEESHMTYKIEITIGDRFGKEFDTPLFVVIHGENGSSEKLYSRQKSWLFSILDFTNNHEEEDVEDNDMNEGRQILPNDKMGIFLTRTIGNLGQLISIDVGHEKEGYGAGTFIQKIFITEEGRTSGRRFYFQVEKWFDSGQVDGLIERNIKLNGLLYLEAPVIRKRESKGRWEFRLHTMQNDLGGTTSNLVVVGYCMHDYMAYAVKNDSLLRDPYSVSLIQLDFGTDYGSLRKIRIEIDGAGDKPNYYLEYVEAMDLDTGERCVIMVHNWLLVEAVHGHRKWQSFREFPILSKLSEPMQMRTYEGTVTFADKSITLSDESPVFLQFLSQGSEEEPEIIAKGSSGKFPIVPTKMKNGNTHFTYKVDVVTDVDYPIIRIIPKNTSFGSDLLDGLALLEEMYEQMVKRKEIVKEDWRLGMALYVEEIQLRFGDHVPHYMPYTKSNIDYEMNNKEGPYFKQMLPITHKSLSTARKLKKEEMRPVEEYSHWELLMTFSFLDGDPDIPIVVLVADDRRTFEMECLTGSFEADPDGYDLFLRYTLTAPNFGNPKKCRISLEEASPDRSTHVVKMLLTELNTKTQVFFKANKQIEEYETYEMACSYPDMGTYPLLEYEVHITTLEGGGDFRPYINILGDRGDTGYRGVPGDRTFSSSPVSELVMSAIDLGVLRSIEVWAKTGEPRKWKGMIKVIVSGEYEFDSGKLELTMNGQIALSALEYKRNIEQPSSGETGESDI